MPCQSGEPHSRETSIWAFFHPLFAWLVVQTAWVGDDACIAFRSLENLLRGYGPVFNVGERVQTFAHPLWFLLQALANAVMGSWPGNPLGTGQLYFVSVFLSIAISVCSGVVLWLGIARGAGSAILAVLLLCGSKAFTEYSTWGLDIRLPTCWPSAS